MRRISRMVFLMAAAFVTISAPFAFASDSAPFAFASETTSRYESLIDFSKIGIGTDVYRLEIEMNVVDRPQTKVNKHIWLYSEPYGYSEYRCETGLDFDAGNARVKLTDTKTGKVLQDYQVNLSAGVSGYYVVKSAHSACSLFWKGALAEETVFGPDLRSFTYAGEEFTLYFYGVTSEVRAHRAGHSYVVDRHAISAQTAPGELLVRYGTPIRWTGTFKVEAK